MTYQKFIPEGWHINKKAINTNILDRAIKTQETLEAKVVNCDEKFIPKFVYLKGAERLRK